MNSELHTALIGIEASGVESWQLLGEGFRLVLRCGSFCDISSIYSTGNSLLSVVTSISTHLGSRELAFLLLAAVPAENFHHQAIKLLQYDDTFSMTPELTLPHPALHQEPRWLVPAAEILGHWLHPVLAETLSQLARPHAYQAGLDFYAQGKSLLDFCEA